MEATPRDGETALCLWALNRRTLDADSIRAYANQWEEFRHRSGLGAARGWAVSVVEPARAGVTTVTARSGDLEVRLFVPERAPIGLVPWKLVVSSAVGCRAPPPRRSSSRSA